ncbi:MAG: folate family ECF transporter S component [Bacillota bacterium]
MRTSISRLASMSLLVAVAVVLKRLASVRIAIGAVEGIRIGFGSLPIVLAGALFGPWGGAAVGAVEDMVGYFINPMGPYMPHFTLTSALTGFIPGLVLWFRREQLPSLLHLVLAIASGQVVVSLGLTPYFLQVLFGIPRSVTIPPRLVALVIDLVLYTSLVHVLLRRLSSSGALVRLGPVRQLRA